MFYSRTNDSKRQGCKHQIAGICNADKAVVEKCGVMSRFIAGDLILADKGFLIRDKVPDGVSVNIPPFLSKGKFTTGANFATDLGN